MKFVRIIRESNLDELEKRINTEIAKQYSNLFYAESIKIIDIDDSDFLICYIIFTTKGIQNENN